MITLCIVIHRMYLLYTSPHTLQIILTSDIFIAIHILFYFVIQPWLLTRNYIFLKLWSVSGTIQL